MRLLPLKRRERQLVERGVHSWFQARLHLRRQVWLATGYATLPTCPETRAACTAFLALRLDGGKAGAAALVPQAGPTLQLHGASQTCPHLGIRRAYRPRQSRVVGRRIAAAEDAATGIEHVDQKVRPGRRPTGPRSTGRLAAPHAKAGRISALPWRGRQRRRDRDGGHRLDDRRYLQASLARPPRQADTRRHPAKHRVLAGRKRHILRSDLRRRRHSMGSDRCRRRCLAAGRPECPSVCWAAGDNCCFIARASSRAGTTPDCDKGSGYHHPAAWRCRLCQKPANSITAIAA